MAIKPIEILINAKDKASPVFQKLGGVVAATGAAIAGYFGIRAFVGAVQGAADLEQGLSRVQAVSGATAEEMTRLREAAEAAGRDTVFTSTEAAAALENLTKAGLSANDAINTLPATLALAQAGDIELAQASEILTKSIMGMGGAFDDAARYADVLAKGANATNSSVEGLGQSLSFAAPTAQSLGLSLESTVAILGKFADAGIDASRAGTSLNNIMSQFSDPASSFRKELSAAGITTNDFEEALHQLADAGPRGEKAINSVGRAAGPALRALLNQGMGALDDLVVTLQNAEGSAAATAATMQDNLRGAFAGLASAWDGLKNTLATPVLPVLQQGVESVAQAFRNAVESGVIKQFGDVIAKTFEAGIKWAGEFVGAFDFSALAERMSAFAATADQTFESIGEKAKTAGDIVSLAWNVMGSGINAVLIGIYGVGATFAGMAQTVQDGLSLIMTGVSKITFGGVSESFKAMAAEIQLSADATGAVFEAFNAKAAAALDRTAEHAESTRRAWSSLTGAIDDTSGAVDRGAESLRRLEKATADADTAAVQAAEKAKAAAAAHAEAAAKTEAARERHEALRAEYQKAIDTGNVQRAAEVMQELRRTTDGAMSSQQDLARQAERTAAETAAAFQAAGVKTKAELQTLADNARREYELIKASGEATTQGLADAWKRAADAAISAADDGIVPAWVRAEASVHGYTVAVDDAGQATVSAADSGVQSVDRLAGSWREAGRASKEYAEAQERLDAKYGSPSDSPSRIGEGGGGHWGSRRDSSQAIKQWIRDNIGAEFVDDARAIKAAAALINAQTFGVGSGTMLSAGGAGTLAAATAQAHELIREMQHEAASRQSAEFEQTRVVNLNMDLGGGRRAAGTVKTDAAGASALESMMLELQQAKRRAA